ncbi:MAG TPA: glycosyltransferase [Parapedobacter sp.]|uniref:glycosyltransferase n=1 Tax=Parapedobacter sp. TaxID=1958893 RepID=UPI002C65F7F1|nr:glycosyltransferase [Parapedobacter sp.]HWK56126.1 glycosyltransferase [Parapedobacter sp.]
MTRRKLKILHTIRQGKIGGGESHVLDLVTHLNSIHFESVILAFTYGPMVSLLTQKGFKVYVIETTRPFDFRIWPKVKKILATEKIDILHAHGTRAASNTILSAKRLGLTTIYTVHGWSFHKNQNFLIKFIRIKSEQFLVRKSDITLCVSENNMKEGKAKFAMERTCVIKNGVDQHKFSLNRQFKDIRTELGIDRSVTLVGFIGRITEQKDPGTLIKAIALLPNDANIRFLIVGNGDMKKTIVDMATSLNVSEKIVFQDFRQDVPDLLNAIDIFCLPSLWEGLPIAVLEAMAMGKAVIATAVDGTKEIITHQHNGLLIATKRSDQLANAIQKLTEKKIEREMLGKEALNTISTNYNIQKMVNKIESVYSTVNAKH